MIIFHVDKASQNRAELN